MTGLTAGHQLKASEQPNVLIIVLDDAGYNDFGFMGSKQIKTPHIDQLASSGVIFTDAHVSASVSAPSRAGILSGRYQQRFGSECNLNSQLGFSLDEETIGDVFKRNGYQTACIGKWHQGNTPEYHPNKRGFDYFHGFISGSRSYFYNPKGSDKPEHTQNLQINGKQISFDGYMTDILADGAISFFRETNKPFMMYLAFNAVHTPMEATKDDLNRFKGHPRQTLAAMTWAVDRAIGKVIDYLKETGKYENTLIFFLSDNGGAYASGANNYPLKGCKGNKFEGGHRVPFFFVWADQIKGNGRYDGLTSSLDIFATAFAAAKIQPSDLKNELDGVNLLPYLKGEKTTEPHEKLFWRKGDMAAARIKEFKLIRVKGLEDKMYNLKENLQEEHNLIPSCPAEYKLLSENLKAWESGLIEPRWRESKNWETVTKEIHHDLMNNQPIRFRTPSDLK